jgi:hypothetical protein
MNFDLQRAAFILIACVIGVQVVIVLTAAMGCLWLALVRDVAAPCKDIKGDLAEMLAGALAVGLALMGVRSIDKR